MVRLLNPHTAIIQINDVWRGLMVQIHNLRELEGAITFIEITNTICNLSDRLLCVIQKRMIQCFLRNAFHAACRSALPVNVVDDRQDALIVYATQPFVISWFLERSELDMTLKCGELSSVCTKLLRNHEIIPSRSVEYLLRVPVSVFYHNPTKDIRCTLLWQIFNSHDRNVFDTFLQRCEPLFTGDVWIIHKQSVHRVIEFSFSSFITQILNKRYSIKTVFNNVGELLYRLQCAHSSMTSVNTILHILPQEMKAIIYTYLGASGCMYSDILVIEENLREFLKYMGFFVRVVGISEQRDRYYVELNDGDSVYKKRNSVLRPTNDEYPFTRRLY
jgi:hypothetical protein